MKTLALAFANAWRGGYGWLSIGMGLRAALQAALVVLLARKLGPMEYGLVVAVTSVTGIFAIFSGAGATTLHLRDLSVGGINHSLSFSTALHRNLFTLPILLVGALAVILALYGTHIGLLTAVLLITAEIVGFAMSDLMQRTMQGGRNYAGMAFYMCIMPGVRVGALIALLVLSTTVNLETWVCIAFASALPPALAVLTRYRFFPKHSERPRHSWVEGLGFAVAAGSTRVHADADKAIVARLSSLDDAARYSLAYRLFDVLMLPILSYIEWRMPALFRAGQRQQGTEALAANRSFIAVVGASSMLAAAVSFPLVSLLPSLLGSGYENVVSIGHWLVFLPVTNALWYIFRSLLSTSGDQSACGAIELAGAAFNVVATIFLVGWLGWKGAVISTYATHLSMSCAGSLRMLRGRGGREA